MKSPAKAAAPRPAASQTAALHSAVYPAAQCKAAAENHLAECQLAQRRTTADVAESPAAQCQSAQRRTTADVAESPAAQGKAAAREPIAHPLSVWPDLSWVDDFWKHAGPYIFSREEDGILILPPNKVYKVNRSGAAIIRYLKEGGKLGLLSKRAKGTALQQLLSLEAFFKTLCGLYTGELLPGAGLEMVPYTFDFSQLPVLGEIAVTYRCNNRCLFCYAGCAPETLREEDISTDEWKKIIRLFREDAKIPFFSFSGGEPLLRPDLEELVSFATRLGLEVNLVSNGTLATRERAQSLYAAGLRTAQISIEAPDAELHDFLAGRTGAFSETVSGIRALMKAGVSVQTNTTITGRSKEAALAMPAFLSALGIKRFAMNMYIPAGSAGDVKLQEDLRISYDEIGPVVDNVRKAAFAEGLTFFWYSPTPFCYYNPIAKGMGNKSCAAVDGLISIAANGDLLPCSSWDEPLGNLLHVPFRELWFSKRALFFKHKQFAPSSCRECGAFTACQGACPIYWRAYGETLLEGKAKPAGKPGLVPAGEAAGGSSPKPAQTAQAMAPAAEAAPDPAGKPAAASAAEPAPFQAGEPSAGPALFQAAEQAVKAGEPTGAPATESAVKAGGVAS